jgi:hypothetical protein
LGSLAAEGLGGFVEVLREAGVVDVVEQACDEAIRRSTRRLTPVGMTASSSG